MNLKNMSNESILRSIEIMRSALSGETFKSIAQRYRMTPTAIRARVMRLSRKLTETGAIADLHPSAMHYISGLRQDRERIEAALGHIELIESCAQRKARSTGHLSLKEVESIIQKAWMRSSAPLRDMALVHIALASGAKPIEIAQLRISDYLNWDGSVRMNSKMRVEISFNLRARPLYFKHPSLIRTIDAYLAERIESRNQCLASSMPCRGFDPKDPLFLDDSGNGFQVECIKGEFRDYYRCHPIQEVYRKIFTRTGRADITPLTIRRTVAVWLHNSGASLQQIGTLLGIADNKNVLKLLPNRPSLLELVSNLYPDIGIPEAAPFKGEAYQPG